MLLAPLATAVSRRTNHSLDFGPGISVTSLRSCGMSISSAPSWAARRLRGAAPATASVHQSVTPEGYACQAAGEPIRRATLYESSMGRPHLGAFGLTSCTTRTIHLW